MSSFDRSMNLTYAPHFQARGQSSSRVLSPAPKSRAGLQVKNLADTTTPPKPEHTRSARTLETAYTREYPLLYVLPLRRCPGSIKVSRLKAPNMPPTAPQPPRRGKNQWAKSMAPSLKQRGPDEGGRKTRRPRHPCNS